jgi:hypothetical protein
VLDVANVQSARSASVLRDLTNELVSLASARDDYAS